MLIDAFAIRWKRFVLDISLGFKRNGIFGGCQRFFLSIVVAFLHTITFKSVMYINVDVDLKMPELRHIRELSPSHSSFFFFFSFGFGCLLWALD